MKARALTLSLAIASLTSLPACKFGEPASTQRNRQGATAQGLFGSSQSNEKQEITLRDGRVIDVPNYKLDSKTAAIVDGNPSSQNILSVLGPVQNEIVTKNGLTSAESAALMLYVGNAYRAYAEYLAGATTFSELSEMSVKEIEALFLATISAVNKFPKTKATVHFGACLPLDVYLPLIRPGEFFSQRNFTSTSMELDTAAIYARCIDKPEHGEMNFTIDNSHSGADISEFSILSFEKEVLFPPAQPFRIKSIKERPKARPDQSVGYNIVLEELK
jgi:hypothetical protein